MKLESLVRRFFFPSFVISLLYDFKFKCFVSPRAEVEYSPLLKVGAGTKISSFCKIKASDGPLVIGSNASIAAGCFIASHEGGLTIGDDCLIGPNVTIVASNYTYDRLDIPMHRQGFRSKGIKIGNDVWVGAGCVILDGSIIGDGAIVIPNSVVRSKLPERSVSQGSPAKVIFTRGDDRSGSGNQKREQGHKKAEKEARGGIQGQGSAGDAQGRHASDTTGGKG
jgi:acetyltransferase-like isoleucine patch superfamily enzyme